MTDGGRYRFLSFTMIKSLIHVRDSMNLYFRFNKMADPDQASGEQVSLLASCQANDPAAYGSSSIVHRRSSRSDCPPVTSSSSQDKPTVNIDTINNSSTSELSSMTGQQLFMFFMIVIASLS